MSHKFPIGEYLTREGCKAVIVGHTPDGKCLGYYTDLNGDSHPLVWGADGVYHPVGNSDLVPPPITWFVNVYAQVDGRISLGGTHGSRSEVNATAENHTVYGHRRTHVLKLIRQGDDVTVEVEKIERMTD